MATLSDQFFGTGSRPLRRDAKAKVGQDADGKPITTFLEGQAITLSRDGSIDQLNVVAESFLNCGHPVHDGVGGQCFECGNISCRPCFEQHCRCQLCKKPICLSCLNEVSSQDNIHKLCGQCADALRRKLRLQAVGRFFLRPFNKSSEKS